MTVTEAKNKARSMRASRALKSYFFVAPTRLRLCNEDAECAINDILADIRHFCDSRGIDFGACDRSAYNHYLAEKGGE